MQSSSFSIIVACFAVALCCVGAYALASAPDKGGSQAYPEPANLGLVSDSAQAESESKAPEGTENVPGTLAEDETARRASSLETPATPTPYATTTDDGIDREHQEHVVLVKLGAETTQTLDALLDLGLFDADAVREACGGSAGNWVSLPLATGVSVPDALEALEGASGIERAQPNYVYRLRDAGDDKAAQATTEEPEELNSAKASDNEEGDGRQEAESKTRADSAASPNGLIEGEPDDLPTIINWNNAYDASAYCTFVNDPQVKNQMIVLTEHAREAYEYTHDANGQPTKWGVEAMRPAIAVLDTGCDIRHEDLAENVIDYYDAVERAKPAHDDFNDIDYHGTHVCGIAAAGTNNSVGIMGISLNAKLVPIKVFKNIDGSVLADSLDILAGYEYVIEHAQDDNIRVVNLSLGSNTDTTDQDDEALLDAIERAHQANILTVISAGNDAILEGGAYSDFPSDFAPSAIGVIDFAVTGWQESESSPYDSLGISLSLSRASYSNYNMAGTVHKQLSALGDSVLSTTPGNRYHRLNGTSMAAPCVSGVAALTLSINPNLSADQLKSVLYSTAEDITPSERNPDAVTEGFDLFTGFGNVDANAAVRGAFCYIDGETSLTTGEDGRLSAVDPSYAGSVTWESNAPGVVGVDDDGAIHAASAGDAIISATLEGSGKVLYTAISVEGPPAADPEEEEPPAPATQTQPMFRLYNPNSGEHFYTANAQERNHLKSLGWSYEGVGWTAPLQGDAVYRLYNPNAGDHHYTTSASERDMLKRAGWNYEGVGWRSSTTKAVTIYREYNPNAIAGAHNFTSSRSEHRHLVSLGWHDEGIGWYGA